MPLKVVAVSAPDWISGAKDGCAINSRDPASLFNACRYAALLAERDHGAWHNSNWAISRLERRRKVMLMYSLDDLAAFERLLVKEKPNMLLIGAMTLCLPGAIQCALRAKAILGQEVFVILGGRHVTETMYLSDPTLRHRDAVRHHPGSPLRLMADGRIPRVFDLAVSGDGEHIIAALGALVDAATTTRGRQQTVDLANLDKNVPGDWIVGALEGGSIRVEVSAGLSIDYNDLPSPSRMFGVTAAFDVFAGRMTAHVFSDIGRGCVYDCSFCSERRSVTGSPRDLSNAGDRLYRQLREAQDVISEDHTTRGASAFVEDSVMLGGSPKLVDRFASLLENRPLRISFGAQFTVDQILTRQSEIVRLARNGLTYLFVGIETLSPTSVGGMSKDVGRNRASWLRRTQEALTFMREHNVSCGCSVLFGLGETHEARIELLQNLSHLQEQIGRPYPVSVNWAVQHPLCGDDAGASYDYIEWGTPDCEFLQYFHGFGEASLLYPLPHVGRPLLSEVQEVSHLLNRLPAPRPMAPALTTDNQPGSWPPN